VTIDDVALRVAGALDAAGIPFGWKLRWARAKDREDVRAVIGVQQDNLDWPYIEGWCERHGARALLDQIRRSVPKL
jgi:hypothetical protein